MRTAIRGRVAAVVACLGLLAPAAVAGAGAEAVAPPSGMPTIRAGFATVFEGDSGQTTAMVPVELSAASTSVVTVDWATFDSRIPFVATGGTDYRAKAGTVTFGPGETRGTIPIQVLGDRGVDRWLFGVEFGLIALSNPVNARFDRGLFARLGIFMIVDDDGPPIWPGCRIGRNRVSSALPQAECDALVDFYEGTGGDWGDDWGTASDPCFWEGVTCGDGTVTGLLLDEKDVRGHLPAALGDLVNLERLDLEEAGGVLSLPPEIGELQKLERIRLFGNELVTLPPEMAGLASLVEVDASDNKLVSLPPEIGSLPRLELLSLWGNRLTSLPPEIGGLSSLRDLDVSMNDLRTLPAEIGSLSGLESLGLRGNQLEGDLTAALLPFVGRDLRIGIGDGFGVGNGCVSVTEPALADWLDAQDPDWDEDCP